MILSWFEVELNEENFSGDSVVVNKIWMLKKELYVPTLVEKLSWAQQVLAEEVWFSAGDNSNVLGSEALVFKTELHFLNFAD